MQYRIGSRQRSKNLGEAAIWTAGLLAVAIADPNAPALIEICLIKATGFFFCPGCGLGHAVGYLARGEFLLSFESHPLAPIVVAILVQRIISLIRQGFITGTPLRESRLHYVQSNQILA